MKVFILAQGKQERLEGVVNGPKQLIAVNGEPIAGRQVRLLKERGVEDVTVVAPHSEEWRAFSEAFGVPIHQLPSPGVNTLDGIYALLGLMDGKQPTLFLLGDVVLSRAAADAIVRERGEFRFFGRRTPNQVTGKQFGELYGVVVAPPAMPKFLTNIGDSWFMGQPGRRLWHLMDKCEDRLKNYGTGARADLLTVIEDYTDDVDEPRDLAALPAIEKADKAEAAPAEAR